MVKMTKSESGKLGSLSTQKYLASEMQRRQFNYSQSPKRCTHCDVPLVWQKRANKFCNQSCAASFNNTKFVKRVKKTSSAKKHRPVRTCKYCGLLTSNCSSQWCNRPQLIKSVAKNFNADMTPYLGSLEYGQKMDELVVQLNKDYKTMSLPLIMQKYNYPRDARSFAKIFKALGLKTRSRQEALVNHHQQIGTYARLDEKEIYYRECKFLFKNYDNIPGHELVPIFGWYHHTRNPNGIVRDHKFSIAEGFRQNVPSWMIRHPANCQLMRQSVNSSKNSRCSITFEELKERIQLWESGAGCRI